MVDSGDIHAGDRRSPRVFVSYRRAGSSWVAGRVVDRLRAAFGDSNTFHDVADIRRGAPFPHEIETSIGASDVVLVLIDGEWNGPNGTRLQEEDDWVRRELELAVQFGCVVMPVLVEGASLPEPAEVPRELIWLLDRQVARLHSGSFETDVIGLLIDIWGHWSHGRDVVVLGDNESDLPASDFVKRLGDLGSAQVIAASRLASGVTVARLSEEAEQKRLIAALYPDEPERWPEVREAVALVQSRHRKQTTVLIATTSASLTAAAATAASEIGASAVSEIGTSMVGGQVGGVAAGDPAGVGWKMLGEIRSWFAARPRGILAIAGAVATVTTVALVSIGGEDSGFPSEREMIQSIVDYRLSFPPPDVLGESLTVDYAECVAEHVVSELGVPLLYERNITVEDPSNLDFGYLEDLRAPYDANVLCSESVLAGSDEFGDLEPRFGGLAWAVALRSLLRGTTDLSFEGSFCVFDRAGLTEEHLDADIYYWYYESDQSDEGREGMERVYRLNEEVNRAYEDLEDACA